MARSWEHRRSNGSHCKLSCLATSLPAVRVAVYYRRTAMTTEFLKFLVTGGLAALANLASRYALNLIMPFEAAVVIAYLIGMTTAYMLARRFVFQRSGRPIGSEVRRFILVNLVALILVWVHQRRPCPHRLSRYRLHLARRGYQPSDRRAGAGRSAATSAIASYTFARGSTRDEEAAMRGDR